MATQVVKVIDPGGTGDYTSLTAWEAARQRNLVSADEVEIARCKTSTGSADTSALSVSGWTTDYAHWVQIESDPDHAPKGIWSTSKYRLSVTNADCINAGQRHLRIFNLQMQVSNSSGAAHYGVYAGSDLAYVVQVSGCFIRCTGTTPKGAGVAGQTSASGGIIRAWNNIITGFSYDSYSDGFRTNDADITLYAYNNTVYGCYNGYRRSIGTVVAKNCMAQECTDGFNGTFDGSSTNNCSDIASDAPGANARTGAVSLVDPLGMTAIDLHLQSSDTVAQGYGADLSGDSNLSFSSDVDGDTRTAPWDIGADQYTATAVSEVDPEDALHSHAPESPSSTQVHVLQVSDSVHAHALSAVVLSLEAPVDLLIDDSAHGHTVDYIHTVEQVVAVLAVIDDAYHAHSADGLRLVRQETVVIADTLHAHSAETITPVQYADVSDSLSDMTQAQRPELPYVDPLHLVDVTLPGGTVLHLSDRDYRYTYGATTIHYDSYLHSISGLGTIIDQGLINSQVDIRIKNQAWGDYDYLSQLDADAAFTRSDVTIYELRVLSSAETFASDVRTVISKLRIEQVIDIGEDTFTLRCGSRLFDSRNASGLSKITKSLYPYADPDDVGKFRNICYGDLEKVPCRSVRAGAIDTLIADLTAGATSIIVSGVARMAFLSSGTIQIDDEKINYTGYANYTFTGCTRGAGGTTATVHDKGASVCQVLTEYIYEVACHPVKSISRVFVDDIRQTASFTAYTGKTGSELAGYEGRAVVKFTVLPVVRKQVNVEVLEEHGHSTATGSHYHANSAINQYTKRFSPYNWYKITDVSSACDGNNVTYAYMVMGSNGTTPYMDLLIEAGNYGSLVKMELHVNFGCSADASNPFQVWYGGVRLCNYTTNQLDGERIFTVQGVSWNHYCTIRWGSTYPPSSFVAKVYNVYAVMYYTADTDDSAATGVNTSRTGATVIGGATVAEAVIGQEVTVDLQGQEDDGAGTYTGVSSALIERPDHVFKHLLMGRLGFPADDIGESFAESGTMYATWGYRFAFIMHDIGSDMQPILNALAAQCRSVCYEWAGVFDLEVLPDAATDPDFSLERSDILEPPRFSRTSAAELRNSINAFYRRKYSSGGRANEAVLGIDPDALARGYMDMIGVDAGDGDLSEDLLLTAVRTSAHAQHLADYYLSQRSDSKIEVSLSAKWRLIQARPGWAISHADPMFGLQTYRLIDFRPDRASGRIMIRGRTY